MPARRYADFIRQNLTLAPVPGVAEISIHTAHSTSRLGRIALDAPYFAYPWAGGIALARYVLDNPGLVAGRRVLDLGAGSGLVAIAAARAGAAVTAAETDPAGVAAIGLNAQANGVRIEIVSHDLLDAPLLPVDLVLAGDVFYAPGVATRMLAFLNRCAACGIDVLVGDPGRTDLPVARLRRIAAFTVDDVASAAVPAGIYAIAGSRLAPAELAR